MIRVGEITYANCLPIFAALRKIVRGDQYEFVRGEPSVLNRMLYAGRIDVAPSSSFEYALHPERYYLIPDLSIASEREVMSVLLISRVPIEELNDQTILLSPVSASSNALVRILLEKQYGHRCSYMPADEDNATNHAEAKARVEIGNLALKAHLQRDKGGYIYDLSLLWNEFTGLPFVFALWMIRRDVLYQQPGEVECLMQELLQARDYALSHFAEFAKTFSAVLEIPDKDLIRYWESISYDLNHKKIVSLGRYFGYAEELGLIPQSPSLEFVRKS